MYLPPSTGASPAMRGVTVSVLPSRSQYTAPCKGAPSAENPILICLRMQSRFS